MSVYTPVTAEEFNAWLIRYNVGALVGMQPIVAGIENTNYFVTTAKGRYVLTLYERLPAEELPFYLNLMAHLARAGVECPAPEPDRTGALFSLLNGKPASLVTRLDGAPVVAPTPAHCAAVGAALARLHVASATYRARLTNRRGPAWWRQAARAVRPHLDAGRNELLAAELRFLTGFGRGAMPRGAIHGDLFCDNVLFSGTRVSGIIDFGFAATDFLAYDLAIAVNDWCSVKEGAGEGELEPELTAAFVRAYDAVRPLTPDERTQWAALLRAAALRFWLSRLYDLHLPRPGELTHAHDPARFERILRDRIATAPRFPAAGAAAGSEARR
jgi:homoserine kinase type II